MRLVYTGLSVMFISLEKSEENTAQITLSH